MSDESRFNVTTISSDLQASYDYMKLMIAELQRQLDEIDSRNKELAASTKSEAPPRAPPRRQNPFNKPSSSNNVNPPAGRKVINN